MKQLNWLFLVHQVFTPNSRERVKVWRAIKKTGAVLYRNSVYVLPYSKERMEDFQWVCQQINDAKGEASVFVSRSSGEKENRALRGLFRKAREEEYGELFANAERLENRIELALKGKRLTDKWQRSLEKEARQIRESFDEIRKVDFFSDSPPRRVVRILDGIATRLASTPEQAGALPLPRYSARQFHKKVWTTREGIHIDRLGSAWLIRRFVDREARFVFAPETSLPSGAIPFDVFGAEFSHRGEDCTFETLMKAFALRDPALRQISEIIHDMDLKDHKFGRTEGDGLDAIVRALAYSSKSDARLLEAGSVILDALFAYFSKTPATRRS